MHIFNRNIYSYLYVHPQKHLPKIICLLFLTIITLIIFSNIVYATENSINKQDILEAQQDTLDINSFIEEADKYTEGIYDDIDMGELFSSAISGKIDNETIMKSILKKIRWGGI